ncbi:DNA repair protein RAD51 homolog 3 [Mercurialis annua]|uniref:DNA repair protein RAD51 homolog 3 n=1 Tax=Mercurialis annua TaxID=3986 RepID=UPI00215EC767|nr:DNA repair protein RAD51 homolog 3 [Mercurialis annua]
MEVKTLPLSSSQRGKLINAGYTSLASLSSVSSSDLARKLNISDSEALEILKVASHSSRLYEEGGSHAVINGAQNAWDMLHEESSLTRITTSCADLDNILGGGISCKEVTEIGGVPGIGKTQLGIQLAVNVQIPLHCGGLGGKAIYIDTEGSFMVERALQVAEASIEDMLEYSRFLRKDLQTCQLEMQSKDILRNIYYFRVCSYTEQIALVHYLEKFVSEHKEVKIVIIDSITFHFRQDFDDSALRTRVLNGMALKLMNIAKSFSLAVVLLNQVTTKHTEGSFQLGLALGESWSHSCTNRLILYWNGNERYAYIDKSPSLRSATAPYTVTKGGIRNSTSNSKRVKMM